MLLIVFFGRKERVQKKKTVVQTDQATADGGDSDRVVGLLQEYRRTWIVIEI